MNMPKARSNLVKEYRKWAYREKWTALGQHWSSQAVHVGWYEALFTLFVCTAPIKTTCWNRSWSVFKRNDTIKLRNPIDLKMVPYSGPKLAGSQGENRSVLERFCVEFWNDTFLMRLPRTWRRGNLFSMNPWMKLIIITTCLQGSLDTKCLVSWQIDRRLVNEQWT